MQNTHGPVEAARQELYDIDGCCKGCGYLAKAHHDDCNVLTELPTENLPEDLNIDGVKTQKFVESFESLYAEVTVTMNTPGIWKVTYCTSLHGVEEEVKYAEVSLLQLYHCAGYVNECESNAQLIFGAVAEAVSTACTENHEFLSSLGYTFGDTRTWMNFLYTRYNDSPFS